MVFQQQASSVHTNPFTSLPTNNASPPPQHPTVQDMLDAISPSICAPGWIIIDETRSFSAAAAQYKGYQLFPHGSLPSQLPSFMRTEVPEGYVCLLNVVHPNQPDRYGNVNIDGTPSPYLHHVHIDVFLDNALLVYTLMTKAMTGDALDRAKNEILSPKGRGDILYGNIILFYRPRSQDLEDAALKDLMEIRITHCQKGK